MFSNDDARPQPPEKPLPGDCCGGGCTPCVLDAYEDEREAYEHALEGWLSAHSPSADVGTPDPEVQRLVLDTNVLLDLLVFDDPRWQVMHQALRDGTCEAVTRADCREEFVRVLRYPQFGLSTPARIAAIEAGDALLGFLATEGPDRVSESEAQPLPVCADPDDQKFLELARQARANVLISKDKALLKLARRMRKAGTFEILSPTTWLDSRAPA